mgnify:FL=1
MYIRRIIGFFLFCSIAFSVFAEMPYRTVLRKADDHFVNREWQEAVAMYDVLLERRPGRVKTYVDAVVASAMMNDSSSIMQYVVRSEMQGLSLDSLFTGIDVLSRSIGQSGIYEQVLLLVKEQQPWFTRVTNNYLLGYYVFRHDAEKILAVADELLSVMPGQINYLKAKADALLLLGNDTAAVEVQKTILDIDSLNFDANLFLGSYYAIKGQEKLKSIDQQYLEDSNGLSISASVYKEEKRQVIDDDIACAKKYFTIAARVRSNKYLSEQLSMLSGLSDELPDRKSVV